MTYHLLFMEGIGYDYNKGPFNGGDTDDDGEDDDESSGGEEFFAKVEEMTTTTEDIAEWDYGDYEGLVVNEIRALRKERGLDQDREWDIWKDGCEGGEYVCPSCLIQWGQFSTSKRSGLNRVGQADLTLMSLCLLGRQSR